ncbi:hypothetical protein L218DRAFT_277511 [Marasmius fiardii PR-910]|nr:hypothetical protein L218DRAFT_277511 [Marasmius fiardii PR-910]
MAVIIPYSGHIMYPTKRIRRTATSVMAGYCDPRPTRDVLTCLLNGVPPYSEEDKAEEAKYNAQLKRLQKKERVEVKRERDKERRRLERAREKALKQQQSISAPPMASSSQSPSTSRPLLVVPTSSSFSTRPNIKLPTHHRATSVTPPPLSSPLPLPSSHENTPDPSISSSTSRTSSKRPRTPDDDEEIVPLLPPPEPKPRRKRVAVKKGWKGWVEGSPPPSEKLINLDAVPILQERRTRSGKNFDAIGVGKDGWV